MKIAKHLMLALIAFVGITACAQKRIFSELPSVEGIEKTYISKGLLRVAKPAILSRSIQGRYNLANLDKINGLEVITVENKKYIGFSRNVLNDYVRNNKLETLLVNDDGEDKNFIYGNPGDDDKVTQFIIVNDEKDELNVVVIWGEFSLTDLASKPSMPTQRTKTMTTTKSSKGTKTTTTTVVNGNDRKTYIITEKNGRADTVIIQNSPFNPLNLN